MFMKGKKLSSRTLIALLIVALIFPVVTANAINSGVDNQTTKEAIEVDSTDITEDTQPKKEDNSGLSEVDPPPSNNQQDYTIKEATIQSIVDGTAPFDNDDEEGNDSSKSNLLVRSYDTISYTLDYSFSSETSLQGAATVFVKGELDKSQKKAQFDEKAIKSKGYEVVSYKGNTLILSVKIDLANPKSIEVPIQIKGMNQGQTIKPTFSVSNSSDFAKSASVTANQVSISSAPNYDIGVESFNNGDFGLLFKMLGDNPEKGIKGLEAPPTDQVVSFDFNTKLSTDSKLDKSMSHLLLDYKMNIETIGENSVLTPKNILGKIPKEYQEDKVIYNGTFNGGKISITETGSGEYHGEITDFKLPEDNIEFPMFNAEDKDDKVEPSYKANEAIISSVYLKTNIEELSKDLSTEANATLEITKFEILDANGEVAEDADEDNNKATEVIKSKDTKNSSKLEEPVSKRLLMGKMDLLGLEFPDIVEDDAYLKSFVLTETLDGTAPRDDSGGVGNDESFTNGIVRSFDRIIYTIGYSVGLSDETVNGQLKTGTYKFKALLPVDAGVATWDLTTMEWLQNPVIKNVSEGQEITGEIVFNESMGASAPRVGNLNWVVQVGAAQNGQVIKEPTFEMWLEGQEDDVKTAGGKLKTTVTAAPNYNAQIKREANSGWTVLVQMRANKKGKGIRGQVLPDVNSNITLNIGLNQDLVLDDYKLNAVGIYGKNGRLSPNLYGDFAPFDDGAKTKVTNFNTVYNGGAVTLSGTNVITATISGYELDPEYITNRATHNASKKHVNQGADYTDDVINITSFYFKTNYNPPDTHKVYRATLRNLRVPIPGQTAKATDNYPDDNMASFADGLRYAPNGPNYRFIADMFRFQMYDKDGSYIGLIGSNEDIKMSPGTYFSMNQSISLGSIPKMYDKIAIFMKFDGDLFEPVENISNNRDLGKVLVNESHGSDEYVDIAPSSGLTLQYVGKTNKGNWTNDAELADSEIYFNRQLKSGSGLRTFDSLSALKSQGYTCVGFLYVFSNKLFLHNYTCYSPLLKVKDNAPLNSSGSLYPKGSADRVGLFRTDYHFYCNDGVDYTVKASSADPSTYPHRHIHAQPGFIPIGYTKVGFDQQENVSTPHRSNLSLGNNSAGVTRYIPERAGASIYIISHEPYVNQSVVQQVTNDGHQEVRSVFNIDQGQTRVDYKVDTGTTGVDASRVTDTITTEVIIPKGMVPVNPNGSTPEEKWGIGYGGIYRQSTSGNGGADGQWITSGQNSVSPRMDQAGSWNQMKSETGTNPSYTVTESVVNGETTLKWTMRNVPVNYAMPTIHYQANIASEMVKSGTELKGTAVTTTNSTGIIVSSGAGATPVKLSGLTTMKVGDPIERTKTDPIRFEISLSNYSLTSGAGIGGETKFRLIDILPYNNDKNGNTDMGNYTLGNIKLDGNVYRGSTGKGGSMTFYYTTAPFEDVVADLESQIGTEKNPTNADYLFNSSSVGWRSVSLSINNDGTIAAASKTRIDNAIKGQKITAIGLASADLGSNSDMSLGYEYMWADPEEKSFYERGVSAKNSVVTIGNTGGTIFQDAYSSGESIPPENPVEGYDVTVNKSADPPSGSQVTTGDAISYYLDVNNTGIKSVPYLVIRDYIPQGTTYIEGSASNNGVYVPASSDKGRAYVEWVLKDVEVGSNEQVNFSVKVNELTSTYIRNAANYEPFSEDNNPGAAGEVEKRPKHTSNETRHVTDQRYDVPPLLDGVKNSDPKPGTEVKFGDIIEYDVAITNKGGLVAKNMYIRDYLPDGTTFVSADKGGTYNPESNFVEWTTNDLGDLPVGETVTVSFKARVNVPNIGKVIKNQALYEFDRIPTSTLDPINKTNVVKHTTPEDPVEGAQVTVYKTANPESGTKVTPGQSITYNLRVHNSGSEKAAYTWVRDYIPASTDYVSMSGEYQGKYINAGPLDGKYVEWMVTDLEPNTSVNLTFTVEVGDIPNTLIPNVGFYDSFDSEDDEGFPGTVTGTFTDKPTTLTNVVEHITDEKPDDPPPARLMVEKKATPEAGQYVKTGDIITYNIDITNQGGEEAFNVFVKDLIPVGTTYLENSANRRGTYNESNPANITWTIDEIKKGETVTLSFKVVVEKPTLGRIIRNQAMYEMNWDPNNTEDPKHKSNIVEHPTIYDANQGSEIGVHKSANPPSGTKVKEDDRITYTLDVENSGVKDENYVIVRDKIPAGSTYVPGSVSNGGAYVVPEDGSSAYVEWVLNLKSGESTKVSFSVWVNEVTKEIAYIDNIANYGAVENDPGPAGTTSDVVDEFSNQTQHATSDTKPVPALLDVTKSATPKAGSVVKAGDKLSYNMAVKNNGGTAAENVFVKDYIPVGTKYVAGSATNNQSAGITGAYSPSGEGTNGFVSWTISNIPAGQTVNVKFEVIVEAPNTGLIIENQALYENEWDPDNPKDPENSSNIVEHNTEKDPVVIGSMSVYKEGSLPGGTIVKEDDRIDYTLRAVNTSKEDIPYAVIRDYIPQGTTYVSGSANASGGVFVPATQTEKAYVEWVIKDLKADEDQTVGFSVTVNENPFGVIRNVGFYDPYEEDPGNPGEIPEGPETPTNPIDYPTRDDEPIPPWVEVEKSAVPKAGTEVISGDTIKYTLEVRNSGGTEAKDVYIKDMIPSGTSYINGSASGDGTYHPAIDGKNAFVDWSIASVDVGEKITLTFSVKVDPGTSDMTIRNQARYEDNWDPDNTREPENGSNVVEHVTPNEPIIGSDVTVHKASDVPGTKVVKEGDKLTYTLRAENSGTKSASFITVRDYIPQGTTYVDGSVTQNGVYVPATETSKAYVEWIIKDLGANESKELSFEITVNANPPIRIHNVGLYDVSDIDPGFEPGDPNIPEPETPTNPIDHTTDKDEPVAALVEAIKKAEPAPGTVVKAGDEITYTIEVTNHGGSKATNVYVKDYIPVGTRYVPGSISSANGGKYHPATDDGENAFVDWTVGNIDGDRTVKLTFKVKVDKPDTGLIIKNHALYENEWDPDNTNEPENKSNTVEHNTPGNINEGEEVVVNKSANVPGTTVVKEGDQITYTLKAANTGTETANYVVVRDYIPTGATYVNGSASEGGAYVSATESEKAYVEWVVSGLKPGDTKDLTFTVQVNKNPPHTIHNRGYYSISDEDPGAPGTITTPPTTPTNKIDHTTDEDEPIPAVLDGTKSADVAYGTEVKAGDRIKYTLVIKNNGGTTAENVYLLDYIPVGTHYVDGSADSSGKYVPAAAGKGSHVSWVFDKIDPGEQVSVSFSVEVNEHNTGITIRNRGLYQDNWDENNPTDPKNETNVVEHTTPTDDVDGSQVTVNKSGDLPPGTIVKPGDTIKYTLSAVNSGITDASYVVIRDYIPQGTTYVEGSGGTYVPATTAHDPYVEWVIKDLAAGETKEVSFSVTVNNNPQTLVHNIGLYDVTEENPGNPGEIPEDPEKPTNPIDYSTDEDRDTPASLQVIKSSEPKAGTTVKSKDIIKYTVKVKNNGTTDAGNVYVKDYIPNGTTYVGNSANHNGVYHPAEGEQYAYVEWNLSKVAGASETNLTFEVRVDNPTTGRVIANQALYEKDWDPTNTDEPKNSSNIVEHDTDRDPINKSQVTVTKKSSVAATDTVKAGDELTYTLTAKNTGTKAAPYVVIRDYIPTGTTYVEGSAEATGGVFVEASENNKAYVEWVLKNLEPGDTQEVNFSVTVNSNSPVIIFNVGLYNPTENNPGEPGEVPEEPETPTNPVENTTDPETPVGPIVVVEKSAEPEVATEIMAGGKIAYTLTVENIGGTDAKDVYLRDYIPSGTIYVKDSASHGGELKTNSKGQYLHWMLREIKPGESISITFEVKLDDIFDGTIIKNQAMYEEGFDPNNPDDPGNTSNITEHTGKGKGQLSLTKSSDKKTSIVKPGDIVKYTIVVKNTGKGPLTDVEVTDAIPNNTSFVSAGQNGEYIDSGNSGSVVWYIDELLHGKSVKLTVSVKIDDSIFNGATIKNVAKATAKDFDGNDVTGVSNTDVLKVDPFGNGGSGKTGDTFKLILMLLLILLIIATIVYAKRKLYSEKNEQLL